MPLSAHLTQFLASVHPYDSLPDAALADLAQICWAQDFAKGDTIFAIGDEVEHLYIMVEGETKITDESGIQLSILGPRNSFGERALLRSEDANLTATVQVQAKMIVIPASVFFTLIKDYAPVARFFDRRRPRRSLDQNVVTMPVEQLMTRDPVSCTPDTPIRDAAAKMHEHRISSICVCNAGRFCGIITLRDMNDHVIVTGRDPQGPISDIMTKQRLVLGPKALVSDVLHLMVERGIGHVPIVDRNKLLGIVTQTDLTRAQAMSSADILRNVARATDAKEIASATAKVPRLLLQLVETGNRHEVVTRLITDIADMATRRLLTLGESKLGPAPVPYLWLACGSQGRQEQTGVSDQDNCLILSDDATKADMPYFVELAKFVNDGLDRCGYYNCPGEMMAANLRWCQPLQAWRDYFTSWIAKPDQEAQMRASVMFDLRPIGGDETLFDNLQAETLRATAGNSIFTAHMISSSLNHQPPLGMLRGLATIRSGEYRNRLDLKHNGVVPVVNLGRIYALQGQLRPMNTRARLEAAIDADILSQSGGADLLGAYDLIATMRLKHQAALIKAGEAPENYLAPSALSDFERSHLRDAFVVVKTMQSAMAAGKEAIG